MYKVEEINEFNKFLTLEKEWNLLLSQSYYNIPFLRHEWFRTWWEHFGNTNQMVVIIIRKANHLVLALPLMEVINSFFFVPFITLQSMTNDHSFCYHLLLRRNEEEALRMLWQYLRHRPRPWDLLLLQDLPSDVPGYELLLNHARQDHHRAELRESYDSPYLPIKGEWEQYLATLKPKFRSNLRNRTGRLQKRDKITYEVISDSNDIKASLAKGIEIEQKSWKGKIGTAIACDPTLTSFYSKWAQTSASENWLRLSFLKVGGHEVAFDYSLSYQNRMYCMKIGYDPEFYPYSVGQLLCAEILKRCFEDNIIEYNFLGESTVQKLDWTQGFRTHVNIFIYNHSLTSNLHFLYKMWFKRNLKLWLKS